MTGIFINYRREDAFGVAGRLFDRLSTNFSRSEMFMDVDAMKPGLDFAKQIDEQVSKCAVVVAIIGPGWVNATDEKGRRRLDLPRDHVRLELATALKRDIPVIPVLINGTAMPSEDDLPEDLKPLPHRHALELRHSRFAADSEAIIHALNDILGGPRRWPRIAGIVGGGLVLVTLFGYLAGQVTLDAIESILAKPREIFTATQSGASRRFVVLPPKPAAQQIPPPPAGSTLPSSPALIGGARIALVIGNAKYPDADQPLKTPVNDARLMSEGLTGAGFTVLSGEDLSTNATREVLDQFYSQVKPGCIVILFLSGYAVQSDHQNYFLPVDAQLWSEADVRHDGVNLETVLNEVHGRGASLKIALIDGSRRNPFERRFRTYSAGLAPVSAPDGTMVMYSAALNAVLNDTGAGNADHSLFVIELLKNVEIPNLTAEEALNQTRLAIAAATHHEQVPWLSLSIAQDFSLGPAPAPAPPR